MVKWPWNARSRLGSSNLNPTRVRRGAAHITPVRVPDVLFMSAPRLVYASPLKAILGEESRDRYSRSLLQVGGREAFWLWCLCMRTKGARRAMYSQPFRHRRFPCDCEHNCRARSISRQGQGGGLHRDATGIKKPFFNLLTSVKSILAVNAGHTVCDAPQSAKQ